MKTGWLYIEKKKKFWGKVHTFFYVAYNYNLAIKVNKFKIEFIPSFHLTGLKEHKISLTGKCQVQIRQNIENLFNLDSVNGVNVLSKSVEEVLLAIYHGCDESVIKRIQEIIKNHV